MPLKSGKSSKVRDENIEELLRKYKNTGKIGNTKPKSMADARRIAVAISYSKQKKSK
jgi:hypothetical protein